MQAVQHDHKDYQDQLDNFDHPNRFDHLKNNNLQKGQKNIKQILKKQISILSICQICRGSVWKDNLFGTTLEQNSLENNLRNLPGTKISKDAIRRLFAKFSPEYTYDKRNSLQNFEKISCKIKIINQIPADIYYI